VAIDALRGLLGRFFQDALGYGVGQAISAAIEPEVQPISNELWAQSPTRPLSPEAAATAVVQGAMARDAAAAEAAQTGTNGERFDTLVQINGSPPGPEQLLSMWDRGIINAAQVRRGLLQSRLKPEWVDAVMATNPALLSITELAEMVVQGVLDQPTAARHAAELSYSAEQFGQLVRLAGSPPGPETALDLWNRGILSEQEATLALRQSRLKPEWIEQYKQLRVRHPSAEAAAEMVVQHVLTPAEGAAEAAKGGVSADLFAHMVEVRGNPPGPETALEWLRRDLISEAEFRLMIAEGNTKTKYTDTYLRTLERIPPARTVTTLVRQGVLGDAEATALIEKYGYSHEIAAGMVKSAHKSNTTHEKDLSLAMIETLYDAGLETTEQATKLVESLGYDAEETARLLNLHDARRYVSEVTRAANVIRGKYVSHQIDRAQALEDLDRLTGNPQARAHLLELWDVERDATVRVLTPAEIGQALKYQIIDDAEYDQRLQRLGYSAADAAVKRQIIHKGPDHPAVGTTP
jgi:hypothetical protein